VLKILKEHAADFTLLIGDINEWRPLSFVIRSLDARFGKSKSPRTFPANYPVFPLDRIWASPPASLLEVSVPRQGLSRLASDHLPIRASFDLSRSRWPLP
jgi:endonuclease/exonuclease/phosphatase family metal-dependent hydrolase